MSDRHPLVTTLEQLDALDDEEVVRGFTEFHKNDPEPGMNHSLSYCHGWRSAAYDHRVLETPGEHHALTRAYMDRNRRLRDRAA